MTGKRSEYFRRFREGLPLATIASEMGCRQETAAQYLAEFIVETRPASIEHWVDGKVYSLIAEHTRTLDEPRFKLIYDHFAGEFTYDQIRLVMAHQRGLAES